MHLENRAGEKLITVLLAFGAELFQRHCGVKSLTSFVQNIQHLVNTRILGTAQRPKQWRLYLGKKNDTILKVSLSNKKTKKYMDNIAVLIDHIFQDDDAKRQKWHDMVRNYNRAMKILQKKNEYTDDDISEFQELIDNFFFSYIEECGAGKEGVTNYIHMLGSGHVKHYMVTHHNLYQFSEQCWESLNAKFKLTFFNHTQHGGNFSKNASEIEKSYLKPSFM